MSKRTLYQKKFHFIQEEREREKTGILQKLLPTYTQGNWETEGISKNETQRERERPYLAFSGLLNIFDKTICLNVCQFIMTRVNLKNLSLFAFWFPGNIIL